MKKATIIIRDEVAKRFRDEKVQTGDMVLFFCRMKAHGRDDYTFEADGFRKTRAKRRQYNLARWMLDEKVE